MTGFCILGAPSDHVLQDVWNSFSSNVWRCDLVDAGTGHAGIAAPKCRRKAQRGSCGKDLGEKSLSSVLGKLQRTQTRIQEQMRRLGDSVDWTRVLHMDEGLSRQCERFCRTLRKGGFYYRGNYLVNWCPRCGMAFSDDEEHHDHKGKIPCYYPLADGATLQDGADCFRNCDDSTRNNAWRLRWRYIREDAV